MGFSRREDFWIIVAARSEDETEIRPGKQPAEEAIKDIRRVTRRHFSAEEKIRVVLEGLRGEERALSTCRIKDAKDRRPARPYAAAAAVAMCSSPRLGRLGGPSCC